MNLSSKAVAWHVGSVAAGAWGMAVFAQSDAVDLYKLIAQLKQTWGDLVILSSMLAPIIAAGAAAYRTWNAKQVPKDVLAVAINPNSSGTLANIGDDVHVAAPTGRGGITEGKIVGALLAGLMLFGANDARAQPSARDIATIKAPAPQSLRDTIIGDLTAARDDAKAFNDPSEVCWSLLLTHAQTVPPKLMGLAHGAQRARDLQRALPAVHDACAVVKDGARQAVLQIFGTFAGATAFMAAFGF